LTLKYKRPLKSKKERFKAVNILLVKDFTIKYLLELQTTVRESNLWGIFGPSRIKGE